MPTRGAPWPQLATDRCGWWTDTTLASLRSAIAEAIETSPTDLFAMGQRGAMVVSKEFSLDALGGAANGVGQHGLVEPRIDYVGRIS